MIEKNLKKAWITPQGDRSTQHALSFESENVHPAWNRISADEQIFPSNVPEDEQRHTIVIRYLDTNELFELRNVIDKYLRNL